MGAVLTRKPEIRFCPRCAGELEWRPAGDAGAEHPTCTRCGFVLWQHPKPSVEALIVRDGSAGLEILLGRRGSDDAWDLPGNFLNEADEIEDALKRECRREMGIEVAVGEIVGAFDDEFLDSRIISLVYVCRVASGEPRPADIIDAVRWFPLSEPPPAAFEAVARAIEALQRRAGLPRREL